MRDRPLALRQGLAGAFMAFFVSGVCPAQDYTLDFETGGIGGRATIRLDGSIEIMEPIVRVRLEIAIDRSRVAQATVVLFDEFKAAESSAEIELTDTTAKVDIRFEPDLIATLPTNERVRAFRVNFCLQHPAPSAPGWVFPLQIKALSFYPARGGKPVEGIGSVADFVVPWGYSSNREFPCYNAPPPPENFVCEILEDGRVLLTWTNPVEYDEIYVDRQWLAGDATSHIDESGGADNWFQYGIEGIVREGETFRRSEGYGCTFVETGEIFGRDTGGHKYAIQLTTDVPNWGGLSGSTLSEATSWGKVSKEANHCMAFVEPSVSLPLVAGAIIEKGITRDRPRLEGFSEESCCA